MSLLATLSLVPQLFSCYSVFVVSFSLTVSDGFSPSFPRYVRCLAILSVIYLPLLEARLSELEERLGTMESQLLAIMDSQAPITGSDRMSVAPASRSPAAEEQPGGWMTRLQPDHTSNCFSPL